MGAARWKGKESGAQEINHQYVGKLLLLAEPLELHVEEAGKGMRSNGIFYVT